VNPGSEVALDIFFVHFFAIHIRDEATRIPTAGQAVGSAIPTFSAKRLATIFWKIGVAGACTPARNAPKAQRNLEKVSRRRSAEIQILPP